MKFCILVIVGWRRKGLKWRILAFDIIPGDLITGIITEDGIIDPI